jgi:hypothetical protein
MLGSSREAAQLAASREGLGSMSDDDDDYYILLFSTINDNFNLSWNYY